MLRGCPGLGGSNNGLYLCLIQALKLTYHVFHRSHVSWGLQRWVILHSVRCLFQGQVWNLFGSLGQGSVHLAFRLKTQLPGGGVVAVPVLLAIWPPRSPVITWAPHAAAPEIKGLSRLEISLQTLWSLPFHPSHNQGPKWMWQACTHAFPHPLPCQLVSRSPITHLWSQRLQGEQADMEAVLGESGWTSLALGPLLVISAEQSANGTSGGEGQQEKEREVDRHSEGQKIRRKWR